MTDSVPLLLLDVDGVLNPFPDTPEGFTEYAFFPEDDEPVRLASFHSDWLGELAAVFEIAWASGWGHDANRLICPLFGLPDFPVISFTAVPFEPRAKVPAVAAFAGDRPAAWVDDLLTQEAQVWAETRTAPTLLLPVDSATGLTRHHVDELLDWAAATGRRRN